MLLGYDQACPFFGVIPGHVCTRRDGGLVREGGACWTWAREDAMRQRTGHPSADAVSQKVADYVDKWGSPPGWPTP